MRNLRLRGGWVEENEYILLEVVWHWDTGLGKERSWHWGSERATWISNQVRFDIILNYRGKECPEQMKKMTSSWNYQFKFG